MPNLGQIISVVGPLVEVCLLWRLTREEMRARYPFLFTYVLYCFLGMDVTLFAIRHVAENIYVRTYWDLELVSLFLRFLVIWEIYRQTFGNTAGPRRTWPLGWGGVGLCLGLVAVCGFTWLLAYRSFHSILLSLECTVGIAQAVLVLGALFGAKLSGIAMGRNMWGLAVGLGAYVSIGVLNYALSDVNGFMMRLLRVVAPSSFVGMVLVWTWALWNYVPNPQTDPARQKLPSEAAAWWARQWERSRDEVRKVVNP